MSVERLEGHIRGLYVGKVSVGGVQPSEGPENLVFFNGCIQDVRIDMNRDAWLRPSLESNVKEGCRVQNPCHGNPCPHNSTCVDLWGHYKCECEVGFVGDKCLPVCEVNPCAEGSKCKPSSKFSLHDHHKYGYTCECDTLHTGEYCEVPLDHPCPSNWWGYPICGPCHCDTVKGYDANCNKTNGECTCEDKHFQPPHSDICFDCDCYATGSFGNRCDLITGQCKCRAGVIGRRCDSCSNPFAEVTLRGCEVVYDGCPQSFSKGIWWDRTLFDQESSHACPKGSVGKATRYCAQDTGWEEPDLFKCTSETFLELADQLAVIERDKLPLSTYFAVKISSDLRLATNLTKNLYGSDILIVDRMLYHVLKYETEQGGLNLTHRQDKDFIQNLVEAASKILEPRYTDMWNRIATFTNAGPEHLILMFEEYAKTLIKNQVDTFTEPFEVTSKNMVFGLDTVSSSELWSYPPGSERAAHNASTTPEKSQFVDASDPDDGPSVLIPKYNNFPKCKKFTDDITRAFIPLKILNIKSIEDVKTLKQKGMQIPKEAAIVAYAIYPTVGQMLPHIYDLSVRQRFGIMLSSNTPMMSLVTQPVNSSSTTQEKNSPNVRFKFKINDVSDHSSPQCAYWDYSQGSRGKWSTDGCVTLGANFMSAQPYINCSCSHLSTFGVLMDITDKEYFMEESTAQDVGILFGYCHLVADASRCLPHLLSAARPADQQQQHSQEPGRLHLPGTAALPYRPQAQETLGTERTLVYRSQMGSFKDVVTFIYVTAADRIVAWNCSLTPSRSNLGSCHSLSERILRSFTFHLLVIFLHYGIYIFVGYCIINKKVRQQLLHTWARMRGKKVPYDESLSGTRTTVRSALAYQNSSFDVLQRNMGISTSSTTSRSTTKTSSSPYRSDSHLKNTSTSTSHAGSDTRRRSSRKGYLYGRHRHKHRVVDDPDTGEINRQRTRDSDSESDLSLDHASLDLASSHSSDEDEYNGDTWKKKAAKKPPEVPPKPNITSESNLYGTNITPSKGFNLSPVSNVAPYTPYTSSWGLPRNILPSTPVGPCEGMGLTVGLPIAPWGRGREKGAQRLQDVSSYLDPNFTPELLGKHT
ncbi:Cadherin EGF LAG seven-pass G-type receptor 2 like protein [Argiope bruennichi]|uniref:Cadherin EGF LAG seven-pass G-type receptor 2 like protein n=1 Tax=Argiope bruennichi TaxID=94029 RepID=A0A8T0G4F5_ARGBR|nr:Cadherin EGF LAG seven-pass G-type receptor 2 like protein [Argiope bruennichi]